jgi:hypothetical protein
LKEKQEKHNQGNKPLDHSLFITTDEAAHLFLQTLLESKVNLRQTTIFLIHLTEFDQLNDQFIKKVNQLITEDSIKGDFPLTIVPISIKGVLTRDDYYVLDTHIRASGHKKIAQLLYERMFLQPQIKREDNDSSTTFGINH